MKKQWKKKSAVRARNWISHSKVGKSLTIFPQKKLLLFSALVFLLVASALIIFFRLSDSQITSEAPASLEYVASQRWSVREYNGSNISDILIKKVCVNAFSSGFDLSGMVLFYANSTACYRYIQSTDSFIMQVSGDIRSNLSDTSGSGWLRYAPGDLVLVWDNETLDFTVAAIKAGIIVQNLYLVAIRNALGGCSVGSGLWPPDSSGVSQARNLIGLPSNLYPIMQFPIGYPKDPYATGTLQPTSGNLPSPLESNKDLMNVFKEKKDLFTEWKSDALPQQKLSNLLWSMYGYSLLGTGHRTTPSAMGEYALQIYGCNTSGAYSYDPLTHSLNLINSTDLRSTIVAHAGVASYLSSAPVIMTICWNSSFGWQGEFQDWLDYQRVMIGLCLQNLYLSANVWDTGVSDAAITTNYDELRGDLQLPEYIYPMYLVGAGEKPSYSLNLHILDWDLIDSIAGAYVYKDSDMKASDTNGWANWTDVGSTVNIKVKWVETWVNGTFSVVVDGDKTIDVRCKIFDIVVKCIEGQQQAALENVNVSLFCGERMIQSGITSKKGKANLFDIPNNTLTFVGYDGNNNLIANDTRTVVSEGQLETIICDKNYEISQMKWEITEIWINSSSIVLPSMLILIAVPQMAWLRRRVRAENYKQDKSRGDGAN